MVGESIHITLSQAACTHLTKKDSASSPMKRMFRQIRGLGPSSTHLHKVHMRIAHFFLLLVFSWLKILCCLKSLIVLQSIKIRPLMVMNSFVFHLSSSPAFFVVLWTSIPTASILGLASQGCLQGNFGSHVAHNLQVPAVNPSER